MRSLVQLGDKVGVGRGGMDGRANGVFAFLEPGRLVDGDLELVLQACYPAAHGMEDSPMYRFAMQSSATGEAMGRIDLRVGHTSHLERYAGHIGYRVETQYRGRHYAARSCQLLFPLARAHGLNPLWITCDPDNLASRRTCELVGGRLAGVVRVPRSSELYRMGQTWKCRYRVDL